MAWSDGNTRVMRGRPAWKSAQGRATAELCPAPPGFIAWGRLDARQSGHHSTGSGRIVANADL